MPDVTEILDDPEVGGGEPFQVVRYTGRRTLGTITKEAQTFDLTGNIQPQDMASQSSTAEDLLTENIVVYAKFGFQTGSNDGSNVYTSADEILYDGKRYRVTRVNDWHKWGFSIAYATRVMDTQETEDATPVTEEGAQGTNENSQGTEENAQGTEESTEVI